MKIDVMRKGDCVINVTSEFLEKRRKNGEVDIIPIIKGEIGLRVDLENIVTIGFGNNTVETKMADGIVVTNF